MMIGDKDLHLPFPALLSRKKGINTLARSVALTVIESKTTAIITCTVIGRTALRISIMSLPECKLLGSREFDIGFNINEISISNDSQFLACVTQETTEVILYGIHIENVSMQLSEQHRINLDIPESDRRKQTLRGLSWFQDHGDRGGVMGLAVLIGDNLLRIDTSTGLPTYISTKSAAMRYIHTFDDNLAVFIQGLGELQVIMVDSGCSSISTTVSHPTGLIDTHTICSSDRVVIGMQDKSVIRVQGTSFVGEASDKRTGFAHILCDKNILHIILRIITTFNAF